MKRIEKVLLIQPGMRIATSGQRIVYPPMGIMYLAAVLEKKGLEVKILDCQTEGLDRDAPMRDGHVEVGIPLEEVGARIEAFEPDMVGISCNFSVMVNSMNETACLAKELCPSAVIVVGGNHPTSMPGEVMENEAIDFVLMGEAEESLPALIEAIEKERSACDGGCGNCTCGEDAEGDVEREEEGEGGSGKGKTEGNTRGKTQGAAKGSDKDRAGDRGAGEGSSAGHGHERPAYAGVSGLVWREDGRLVINPQGPFIKDLDTLPFPAWHLFPYEKYSRNYEPRTVTWGEPQAMPTVLTTRGCAGRCVFCSVHRTMGRKFRARRLDEVFREISFLIERYGIKKLMIIDDNFTHDRARAKEFCREFKRRGFDIEIHFMVLALWCMDEELIDELVDIGCVSMGFAIESGVQDVLTKVVKKPLNLERAMEVLRYARKRGVHLTGTFVIGLPGETKEDIRRSLYMANYSGLFDSREVYIATPLPGSELFERCRDEGLFAEGFSYDRVEVVKPNIRTRDFSPRYIETIVEADRTHHLIKSNPRRAPLYIRDVWRRKRPIFMNVLYETSAMFVKYDLLKMKERYP